MLTDKASQSIDRAALMPKRYTAEQYAGLMTADPPVCAVGPALAVLRRCERLRRGDTCYCRIYSRELADDLVAAGFDRIADYLTESMEPEDVDALVEEMGAIDVIAAPDAEVRGRIEVGRSLLARLARHGAGLTDEYSDDIE